MSQSGDFEVAARAPDLANKNLDEVREAFGRCFEAAYQAQHVLGQSRDVSVAYAMELSEKTLQCAEEYLYTSFELAQPYHQARCLRSSE